MKSFQLHIQGNVQGVGFRSWVRREADKLNIVGWVKNREDGGVEALIQGDALSIHTLIELCKKGPEVAWVEQVIITEQPVDDSLLTFQVVY